MSEGVFFERVTLPSGEWVDLRPPAAVPEKLRRPVKRIAVKAAQEHPDLVTGNPEVSVDVIDIWDEFTDLAIVAMVGAWSFDQPITVDAVQSLGGKDYEALAKAVEPHVKDLLPNFGMPEPSDDPKGNPPGGS